MKVRQLMEEIANLPGDMEIYVCDNSDGFDASNRFDLSMIYQKTISHSSVHKEHILIMEGNVL